MNFHRLPFVIFSVVVLVIAGSLTYFYTIWKEPPGPEYSWGGNSTLAVNLTLSRTNISINETLNYTIKLKNTGWESIRVYIDFDFPTILIYKVHILWYNSSELPFEGPFLGDGLRIGNYTKKTGRTTAISDPAKFNKHLVILGPGEDISCPGSIFMGHPGAGGSDIDPGKTYTLQGQYRFTENREFPALPSWKGDIRSELAWFSVLP